jgi:hypothetical protein
MIGEVGEEGSGLGNGVAGVGFIEVFDVALISSSPVDDWGAGEGPGESIKLLEGEATRIC